MNTTAAVEHARKRILVVEDDSAVRRLIELSLHAHFDVETAEDGAVALARVADPPAIDLVLCDIMMPRMNGLELVKQMRALDAPSVSRIPVVFLTARDRPDDVIAGINGGARQYLTKPFKVDDLVKKLHNLLRV